MKEIIGYVRSIPGGEGIANVPVSIRLKKDGTLVAPGGMEQASANPIMTDANGRFSWSCELSPGIVKVEAAIDSTAEMKVRVGDEIMQADDMFISDMSTIGQMFTNGIIEGVDGNFAVTPVVGSLQVAVAAGAINMYGHIFRTHTVRNLTVDANPEFATRIDTVYVTHYHSGADKGKQIIGIAKGIANNTPAAVPTVAGTWSLAIARVTVPLGATSVTTTMVGPTAAPTSTKINNDSILLQHLAPEVEDQLLNSTFSIINPTTGQHLAYNGTKFVNEDNTIANLDDAVIASPVAGQVLAYSTGKWRNSTLTFTVPAPAFAEQVISSYGELDNNVLLGSVSVEVPKGTWMLVGEVYGQAFVTNGGAGTANIWLQGSAVTGKSLTSRQTVVRGKGDGIRSFQLTTRLMVGPVATTTYTLDLWGAHASGDRHTLYPIVLVLKAL